MKTGYLLIDTVTEYPGSRISLLDKNFKEIKKFRTKSRNVIGLLKKANASLLTSELKAIVVVKGPGEFSAVRQGVVMANSLVFTLGLTLREVKVGQSVSAARSACKYAEPEYLRPPNITNKATHRA